MQKSIINQNKDPFSKQLFYRGKQWLYRGQKPGWIAKTLNRMWANAASKKVMDNGLVALEVIGRKSGRVVSFPLVMFTVDEQRYLASMLGKEAQWVRNVRAAGGKAVLRSGGYENVQLVEIPTDQRAPLLKAYRERVRMCRLTWTLRSLISTRSPWNSRSSGLSPTKRNNK
jgi:deazaflavin-dependent oxidoreductase (nitroreductase family)